LPCSNAGPKPQPSATKLHFVFNVEIAALLLDDGQEVIDEDRIYQAIRADTVRTMLSAL
jgi:hypothetical protein